MIKALPLNVVTNERDSLGRGLPDGIVAIGAGFGLACRLGGDALAVWCQDILYSSALNNDPGDPSTVVSHVHRIRSRFGLRRFEWEEERGILMAARNREDVQGVRQGVGRESK